MLILFQTLKRRVSRGQPCSRSTAGERLGSPHGSTGKKRSCFPGSLPGPIDDWRDVASSTRYIRTRSPRNLLEKGSTPMWYIGLDWADTHNDVEVMDHNGKRLAARRFAHSHDGLNALKAFVLSCAPSPEQLACIVETNHGLLITFLLEAGIPVYPVNPKTTNRLRKAAGAKTDRIDAHLLAKTGRFDLAELRRLEPDSPSVAELKTLTRDQDALIQTQTRLVNQLTACLKEYYPAALHLFAKLQQRSALVFLQAYPTPQAAQAATIEEITATLRRSKHTNPGRAAAKIALELRRPQLVAS